MSETTELTMETRLSIFKTAMNELIEGCWRPNNCNTKNEHSDCDQTNFTHFYMKYCNSLPNHIMKGLARLHLIRHTVNNCAKEVYDFVAYDFPKFMEYFGPEMVEIMDGAASDYTQELIYMGLQQNTCSFPLVQRNEEFIKEFN